MVACCQCGAYEYIHRDRSFHKFPKNPQLRAKWLAAIGRTEIYASARLCSNHFDYNDFNNDQYNSRRTLLPGIVPHRNLEKRVRRDRGLICNQIEFNKNVESTNKHIENVNNKDSINNNYEEEILDDPGEMEINNTEEQLVVSNVEIITEDTELLSNDTEYEETIVIISPREKNINCADDVLNNEERETDQSLNTEEISSQKRILNNINISNIKRIKLELLNKNTFVMTRRNFTTDEAWYAFALNHILKRQEDKTLQTKTNRLKDKVLNLQSILQILRHKNYVSKTGAAKILEIVPPEVQEMLQIMLSEKKGLKFSDELKSFATTLHYYSPAGYQYVRNTFLKCLPHVKTLGKSRLVLKSTQDSKALQENKESNVAESFVSLYSEVSVNDSYNEVYNTNTPNSTHH